MRAAFVMFLFKIFPVLFSARTAANPDYECCQAYYGGNLVSLRYNNTSASCHIFHLLSRVSPHPTQKHAMDLSGLRQAELAGIPVLRMFLELYIDAFGVFNKKAYSPDGIYLTFGNMSRAERNKPDNIFCIGMKPPRTTMDEYLPVYILDIIRLQKGYFIDIHDKRHFVIGALGIVKAGNDYNP